MSLAAGTDRTKDLAERFAACAPGLPGQAPWLKKLRRRAIERFVEAGLPALKLEDWKFTNLAPLAAIDFRPIDAQPAAAASIAPFVLAEPTFRMVFVGGRFQAPLSDLEALPDGVSVSSLAQELERGDEALAPRFEAPRDRAKALIALNAAYAADGAVIRLAEDVRLDRPIHLLFLADGGMGRLFQPRTLILMEAGSDATILESFGADRDALSWSNAVVQIALGSHARLRHYKLQAECASAYHIAATDVALNEGSRYEALALAVGGRLARNEVEVRLEGAGAEVKLDALSLANGRQHLDTTTRIVHGATDGSSRQLCKSVAAGQSRTVFQGRIRVAPGASRTDAQQLSRNLLLAPQAQADAKPELEILADDVKCSHGASVGDIDKDALFYLTSRGLDEAASRRLLIEAFVNEAIEGIADDGAKAYIHKAVANWLEALEG
jgi:Fe-S cluster assembly protein SufD